VRVAVPRRALPPRLLLSIGAAAAAGFALVAYLVLARATTPFDVAVHRWMVAHQDPLAARVFLWVTIAGGITGMRMLAIAGGLYLAMRGRIGAGILLAVIPFLANLFFDAAKRLSARPRPPGLGAPMDASYAFPSGHSMVSAAVCGGLGYLWWRAGLLRGGTALAMATAVPLLVGLSRLYLDVHWATDVIGGWCAGLCMAALSAALHDRIGHRVFLHTEQSS
jgi:membrane-associated phospholipid phosphatase